MPLDSSPIKAVLDDLRFMQPITEEGDPWYLDTGLHEHTLLHGKCGRHTNPAWLVFKQYLVGALGLKEHRYAGLSFFVAKKDIAVGYLMMKSQYVIFVNESSDASVHQNVASLVAKSKAAVLGALARKQVAISVFSTLDYDTAKKILKTGSIGFVERVSGAKPVEAAEKKLVVEGMSLDALASLISWKMTSGFWAEDADGVTKSNV